VDILNKEAGKVKEVNNCGSITREVNMKSNPDCRENSRYLCHTSPPSHKLLQGRRSDKKSSGGSGTAVPMTAPGWEGTEAGMAGGIVCKIPACRMAQSSVQEGWFHGTKGNSILHPAAHFTCLWTSASSLGTLEVIMTHVG
jgi:hypothetical protein